MHLDWKVRLYVPPPNLKSNISNVLEHLKDINFFQSFASIGRVNLVYMLPDEPKMQIKFSSVPKGNLRPVCRNKCTC